MQVREHIDLADHTTIGLGGPARYWADCFSVADITEALAFARQHNLPAHVLGGGSNSIFADEGFAGLIVAVRIDGLTFSDDGTLEAGAGEPWDPLVEQTIARNLAGFECLSGIPGLVGATPIQNVGAYGQEVAEVIESVAAIDMATGQAVTFTNEECQFGYRTSRFKTTDAGKYIIASVRYRLRPGGKPTLRYPQLKEALNGKDGTVGLSAVRDAVLQLRRSKSMVIDPQDPNTRSCGSFFVNPIVSKAHLAKLQQTHADIPYFTGEETPHGTAGSDWTRDHVKVPAAWLVEQAGFAKGLKQDGVGTSANHPLALINIDGTTKHLLALAADIQARVQQQFDIQLEQEPVVVPQSPAVQ